MLVIVCEGHIQGQGHSRQLKRLYKIQCTKCCSTAVHTQSASYACGIY